VLLNVFDRVKIKGVSKPIFYLCNPVSRKLGFNCICLVNRSIILHKQVPIIKLFKNRSYFYFTNLQI